MNFDFACPVCGCGLTRAGRTLKCENGHCFDLAKQGYVNLLQSQKSSAKRHGDDKLMVKSRFDFLNKGYYAGLAELIVSKIGSIAFPGMKLADLGCGECYYTSIIAQSFPEISVGGIDISKEALIAGSKRDKNISLAVASTFALPISDGFCDAVVSVFAPYSFDEIRRVLKKGGYFLRVYPLEKHLMGLKALIYEKPYLNEVDRSVPDGFRIFDRDELKYDIHIDNNEDIFALFTMTPYYYKTGRSDQEKLKKINFLNSEIEFGIDVLQKI